MLGWEVYISRRMDHMIFKHAFIGESYTVAGTLKYIISISLVLSTAVPRYKVQEQLCCPDMSAPARKLKK